MTLNKYYHVLTYNYMESENKEVETYLKTMRMLVPTLKKNTSKQEKRENWTQFERISRIEG